MAGITEAAETINFCIAHQKKIVDDVLTFSKLDASMLTLSPRRDHPKQDIQFEYNFTILTQNAELVGC